MKRKTLIIAGAMALLAGTGTWAIGLGAQFNANISAETGFAPGWAIAVSPTEKLHLAVFWDFADADASIFGLTLDLWFLNPDVVRMGSAGTMGLFAGAGLYTSYATLDGGAFSFGVRIPLGVNFHFLERVLELFIQAAPSFGLELFPKLSLGAPSIPVSLGFRFWIQSGGAK